MTEQLNIKGKDIWITVEPLELYKDMPENTQAEYFIAFYHSQQPGETLGKLFRNHHQRAKVFASPVEALEYANEVLVGMV